LLSAVWVASDFTSEATTAKPLPASPAARLPMVALSARRLVCSAMPLISATDVADAFGGVLELAMV